MLRNFLARSSMQTLCMEVSSQGLEGIGLSIPMEGMNLELVLCPVNGGHLLDHKQYHIFRPNDPLFAEKIATVADGMYNRTAIQDEAPAKFFFKGLIPPKTPDVLRHEFQKYVEKDSDSTIHSTKFVAFVIQYAAVELGVNYVDFFNIRHTKVVPSELVEVLKHNMKFEEFKSQALVRHAEGDNMQQRH